VTGRNTYDVSGAWSGRGPLPGVPLFVVTHAVPDDVPAGDPPYTFVTDGVENAIEQARATASAVGKDVDLMGADMLQQALRAGVEAPGVTHLTYRIVR
jgi:dihydrofolate reductase